VAGALRDKGEIVEVHDEHFDTDARDEEWLDLIGRKGWIAITRDEKIRKNRLQRQLLIDANAKAFILRAGNLTGPQLAAIVLDNLEAMKALAAAQGAPFIALVSRSGVRLYHPSPDRADAD
jgi:predicted nuclease of predicted toxin-antitoxin system